MPFYGSVQSVRLAASGQAVPRACLVLGFSYSNTTVAGNIRIYDGTGVGGILKCQITPQAALGSESNYVPIKFHCLTGCYVAMSGGATPVNVVYQ